MKRVFGKNAAIALSYTILFLAFSFFLSKPDADTLMNVVFTTLAVFHLLGTLALTIIYNRRSAINRRNGHLVSFFFICLLLILVHVIRSVFS